MAINFDKSSGKAAKPPIYKDKGQCYYDRGSFPISHPFGPHGESAGRLFFIKNGRREASRRPDSLSSSAAAAPLAVDAAVQVSHFPLGGGEELLELVLKGLVPGGGQGLLGRPVEIRPGLSHGPGCNRSAGRPLRPGRGALLRLGLLDGKIDLPVFRGQDQHLDSLSLL